MEQQSHNFKVLNSAKKNDVNFFVDDHQQENFDLDEAVVDQYFSEQKPSSGKGITEEVSF